MSVCVCVRACACVCVNVCACVRVYEYNPVSHDFVPMLTKMYLLNLVPEQDYLTYLVLHRTKCKPKHFEWKRFSDIFVLQRTTFKPMHLNREKFSNYDFCSRYFSCPYMAAQLSHLTLLWQRVRCGLEQSYCLE